MNKIDFSVWLAIFTNFIGLMVFLWKLSEWKTRLIVKIDQNYNDINALGKALRDEIKRRDRNILIKVDTLVEYMENKSDFKAPKMKDEDY